ncbi:MAG: CRISPR-associated endonuclease Cas2 [Kiritimatiellae bacterium]|nr:CRISPR-associated endonuclease Cas2 [Kiritimatiellia bacterium]
MRTFACLVVYDIASPKRLRKVAKVMQSFGVRVQKSVFECDLGEADRERMLLQAEKVMVEEEDQVRLYRLSHRALHGVVRIGTPSSSLPEPAVVA